jgi:RNA polymerase sigma-70 factor (ECF subfamily)
MHNEWSTVTLVDFNAFFAQSCPEMLARALMLSGNRHDAEDAVQEAYVEALVRWERISTYENPGAWVYRIVRQRLWKSRRRWERLRSLGSDEAIARHAVDGDPERATEAGMALSALASLPSRQRMVMVMHCLHHMAQQQIADELGLTRGAVAASIFKARRSLEKALGLRDTEFTADTPMMASEPEPKSRPAALRKLDPLEVVLDAMLLWLRQSASGEGSEQWLDHIHREAHVRAIEPGKAQ